MYLILATFQLYVMAALPRGTRSPVHIEWGPGLGWSVKRKNSIDSVRYRTPFTPSPALSISQHIG